MRIVTCSKEAADANAEPSFDQEMGVDFTNKDDRAVFTYNFFKMALSRNSYVGVNS